MISGMPQVQPNCLIWSPIMKCSPNSGPRYHTTYPYRQQMMSSLVPCFLPWTERWRQWSARWCLISTTSLPEVHAALNGQENDCNFRTKSRDKQARASSEG